MKIKIECDLDSWTVEVPEDMTVEKLTEKAKKYFILKSGEYELRLKQSGSPLSIPEKVKNCVFSGTILVLKKIK